MTQKGEMKPATCPLKVVVTDVPPQHITVEAVSAAEIGADGGSTMEGGSTGGWHTDHQEELTLAYLKL
jgi:hypothetical protein